MDVGGIVAALDEGDELGNNSHSIIVSVHATFLKASVMHDFKQSGVVVCAMSSYEYSTVTFPLASVIMSVTKVLVPSQVFTVTFFPLRSGLHPVLGPRYTTLTSKLAVLSPVGLTEKLGAVDAKVITFIFVQLSIRSGIPEVLDVASRQTFHSPGLRLTVASYVVSFGP